MIKRNILETTYREVKNDLFELIDLLEIKIDCSYVLEELEEIEYKVRKINKIGDPIVEEIARTYHTLYKKYEKKLASFLTQKETEKLIEKIKKWIVRLPLLF
ncbi:MAG: hypothetical protein ACTSQE_07960 [Candidatus Heimdallarchaeaceae archaeon]